ncbi:MAG: chemotaxis protein CheX [Phycisphaerae bacterium]|nr:chemotaxis protein CheX [Phycisphaerae bacterium]
MSPNQPTPNFNELLFHVSEQTFGELAFMLVESDELHAGAPSAPPKWGYVSRVEFSGPFGGEMRISITEEMLQPLGSNMLGIDEFEEVPEGVRLEDALKELINVTCGNLLPVLGGDQAIFNIAAPDVVAGSVPPPPERYTFAGSTLLQLDNGTAQVELYLSPDARVVDTAQAQGTANEEML